MRAVTKPTRIRIERRGNQIRVYAGQPNQPLTAPGPQIIEFNGPIYAGLAMCSHDAGVLETAVFSNVRIEQSVGQFDRSARAQLAEQQRNLRDKIVAEIREVLNKKARTAGFGAVLDSAAESAVGTPIVLFNATLPDLTEEILIHLNATAPAGALQTPLAPAPAPIITK